MKCPVLVEIMRWRVLALGKISEAEMGQECLEFGLDVLIQRFLVRTHCETREKRE